MKNRILLLVFLTGIILNVAGYFLGDFITVYIKYHLFFDSTGTILSAVILGPLVGALTGFTSNLILGVTHNPVNIPFSIVNIIIGITAGFVSGRYGFLTAKSLVICILSVSFTSALGGAIVAVYVFGGVTGAIVDLNILSVMEAGYRLLTSSFFVRIPPNLLDKSLSALIVFIIIRYLNPVYRGSALKR
jgi:energy-coupling factor transport system substrate-specific component